MPELIRQDTGQPVLAAEARATPKTYQGKSVRWGGEILSVKNLVDITEVEILKRPLYSGGEPKPEGGEAIRFIARISGFLDPADYQPGQRMTVSGRLNGTRVQNVGDYAYSYPLVVAVAYHRWDKYEPPEPYWSRYPYWWDPWWPYHRYYPYYPWRYHPYWW